MAPTGGQQETLVVEHIKQFPGQVHGEEVQREVAARCGAMAAPAAPTPTAPAMPAATEEEA